MDESESKGLSISLEDYLETIYILIQEHKVARVRDIARARDVNMSSVSPAMRRLAELDLVVYNQREFIELTSEGERIARKIMTCHILLRQFLNEFLKVSKENSEADACALEHHLSGESVDKLVRFFEFIESSRKEKKEFINEFIDNFHNGILAASKLPEERQGIRVKLDREAVRKKGKVKTLYDLHPGEKGRVIKVISNGAIRQRLIDMGMIPNTIVEIERVVPGGGPIWIKLKGFQLSLRREEAAGIVIN